MWLRSFLINLGLSFYRWKNRSAESSLRSQTYKGPLGIFKLLEMWYMLRCAAIGMSRLFCCLDWRFCLLQPSPLGASNVSSLTHFHHALSSFTCTLTPVEKKRAGCRQTTGNAGKSSLAKERRAARVSQVLASTLNQVWAWPVSHLLLKTRSETLLSVMGLDLIC